MAVEWVAVGGVMEFVAKVLERGLFAVPGAWRLDAW
jgi:hypothetical protein